MFLFVLLVVGIYYTGYIPYTDRYHLRLVETYYLNMLQCRTCAGIVECMDSVSFETGEYMRLHASALEEKYPKKFLQQHVLSLKCIDSDGDPIDFS